MCVCLCGFLPCGCVWVWVLQLADLQTDNEDMQRSVQQLRKKCQKLTAELQDTKLHLEGLQSRNHDLEKKQRKSVCLPLSSPFIHAHFLENRFLVTHSAER